LKVTGIDISRGLIKTAKRFAKEKGLKIAYEVRHGKDLRYQEEFDCVIIAFNSFSLFSPEDAPVVLQGIHKALKKGGRIFMDLDNKPFNCRYGASYRDWCTWSGGIILQEVYFHQDISVEVNRDLSLNTESDQVEEFIIFKRIYSKDDIFDLFSKCGFRIDKIYGGWDLSPLDENSPKMILVGAKKEKE
jgi:SAM-dependent methyltransferase